MKQMLRCYNVKLTTLRTNINIADMTHKSRDSIGINLIDLEDKPSQELIENIKNIDHVISVRLCSNL